MSRNVSWFDDNMDNGQVSDNLVLAPPQCQEKFEAIIKTLIHLFFLMIWPGRIEQIQ